MSVRIGKIELTGVQDLHTEEARTLVEQRVPEQQGSVFQDLGREPLTIVIDGLLFGADALSSLETLRRRSGGGHRPHRSGDRGFSRSPAGRLPGSFPLQPAPARTHRAAPGQRRGHGRRERRRGHRCRGVGRRQPRRRRRAAGSGLPRRGPFGQPRAARQPRHGRPRRRRGQQPGQPRRKARPSSSSSIRPSSAR